jgi:hypothetical protein
MTYQQSATQSPTFQNTTIFITRETLHLELFSYINLSNKDALIRPKISYEVSKNNRAVTIDIISAQLSLELPGLRGFSPTGIKRMRTFYETWKDVFANRPMPSDETKIIVNTKPTVAQIHKNQI